MLLHDVSMLENPLSGIGSDASIAVGGDVLAEKSSYLSYLDSPAVFDTDISVLHQPCVMKIAVSLG